MGAFCDTIYRGGFRKLFKDCTVEFHYTVDGIEYNGKTEDCDYTNTVNTNFAIYLKNDTPNEYLLEERITLRTIAPLVGVGLEI